MRGSRRAPEARARGNGQKLVTPNDQGLPVEGVTTPARSAGQRHRTKTRDPEPRELPWRGSRRPREARAKRQRTKTRDPERPGNFPGGGHEFLSGWRSTFCQPIRCNRARSAAHPGRRERSCARCASGCARAPAHGVRDARQKSELRPEYLSSRALNCTRVVAAVTAAADRDVHDLRPDSARLSAKQDSNARALHFTRGIADGFVESAVARFLNGRRPEDATHHV